MGAYKGNEPYVFASYSHKDKNLVLPIIEELQNRGFRVWYDKRGISAGSEWPDVIADRLEKCCCMVAFVSHSFGESNNCREELGFAKDLKKTILVIYLEDREKLRASIRMRLVTLHSLSLRDYADTAAFLNEVSEEEALQPCLGLPATSVPQKPACPSAEELFIQGSVYLDRKEYAEAVRLLREAADQGHVGAQNNLACCYQNGNGVTRDRAEAAKWFRKAAEQGAAYAQNNLGWCYENGNGVLRDCTEAVKWYRKAAEQGDAPAQRNLGWCYENGKGIPQNYAEAAKWFQRAAEQGEVHAQYSLGYCYEFGRGTKKDKAEARKWYQKAADQGHERAIERIKTLQ